MRIVPKLDWLTVTQPYTTGKTETPTNPQTAVAVAQRLLRDSHPQWDGEMIVIERNEPFYQHHFSTNEGWLLSLSELQSQGVRLVCSGTTLPVGQSEQRKMYEHLRDQQWRVARADVAIDILDSSIQIYDYWKDGLEEQALARRYKSDLILSPNGDTIVVGSRKSDKFLKLYDKGKEQKTERDWKRIELEVKYKTAHHLPQIYNMVIRRGAVTISEMLSYLPETIRAGIEAIGKDCEKFNKPAPKTRGNKELWLMEQVLPALLNVRNENPSLYNKFCESLFGVTD